VEARPLIADRIAGAFVLAVLAAACLVFWIGIPIGVLWALSKATDDATTHFVSGLLGVPLAMALFSPFLFFLNNLYLRVTGVLDRLAEDEEESGWQRRVRGPLEPMMFLSLAVAIVALCIWFFFIAEDPPRQII
jgi:ABC-type dipeptide/oligopeptide/nickel transport system permease component